MFRVARTLVALSNRAVLVAIALTFALAATLGYFVSWWCLYVPAGIFVIGLVNCLVVLLRSAMRVGWAKTLFDLLCQLDVVRAELEAEDRTAQARLATNHAKLAAMRGEGHWPCNVRPLDFTKPRKCQDGKPEGYNPPHPPARRENPRLSVPEFQMSSPPGIYLDPPPLTWPEDPKPEPTPDADAPSEPPRLRRVK